MKKIFVLVSALFLFLLLTLPVLAKNEAPRGLEDKGPLTRITLIHYKRGYGKPPHAGGGKPKDKDSACYTYLSKGAKWKTIEDYFINPDGLDSEFVKNAVVAGVEEWEEYSPKDIFGAGTINYSFDFNNGDYDEKNTASFGPYDDGVIAIANVWGYFYGPPKTREIIEWDILFNDYYDWGNATVDSELMDLQNIATHELGHAAGMGDLYETTCAEETMYGYSINGETKKQTLNPGDIAGIKSLYK